MARSRKKAAYRRNNQNRFSMFLVTLVVVIIMVVVTIGGVQVSGKIDTNNARIAQLQEQIADEEERTQEIEEYRKYTQTKRYKEEVAKDKLGMVYEGEILFKEED